MTRPLPVVFVLAVLAAASAPAAAGAKLEARYEVTYTGVTLGQGALVVEVHEEGYSAAGSAAVAGLLKVLNAAKGSAAARGEFVGGKVTPVSYSVTSETKEKAEEIRLAGAAGTIHDLVVAPPRREEKDRVPITEEHRIGAVDPMSAALMPVQPGSDLAGADACNRTLPIYDGHHRYDLVLSYQRTETAKDVKGFSGPIAVCRVAYRPIAGHRPNRKQTRELAENKDIRTWLAPIAGTRVLVPMRVTIGTAIGTFVVQATHFAVEPKSRAAMDSIAR